MSDPDPGVESNSLQYRLRNPARGRITADDLARSWFDQTIHVRLGGAGRLIRNPELANHFRRSLGGALGTGASVDCAATHPPSPCPWEPPCALDVFFREQMRVGDHGLPKPFVTLVDVDGPDLIAGLRVFGFATEWMPAVEHAFVDALRHRLPWRKLGIAAPPVLDRIVATCDGVAADDPPADAQLGWITPLDADKMDPAEKVGSILTRLHRRLGGMARWHDADLMALDPETLDRWRMAARAGRLTTGVTSEKRDGKLRRIPVAGGTLALEGDLSPFWAMLRLGERCAVGRGAVRGQGRYVLH